VKGRIALGSFALGVASTLGVLGLTGSVPAEASATAQLDRTAFNQAVDAVMNRYYEPVDEAALLSAGLRAMLAQLDPHSHFLAADERKALRKRAGVTGLSVALRRDDQGPHLEILAVAPDSPAHRQGLRPGDRLVRIGEREATALGTQAEVEMLLAGAIGDEVALLVQSPDRPEPRTLELVLDKPRAKMVESAIVEDAAGRKFIHLVVRRFGPESGDAVHRALASKQRALGDALAGVILDLRGNPGGEVDEALVVADRFVAKGVLTRTRGRGGRILREESAHAGNTDTTTPLVVLQDRHSASASELLAVALQDHHRALVVGERSYGKGTVQEVLGLPDGSAATFTIARYYSPGDRPIDGEGVVPDVPVLLSPTTPAAGVVDDGLQAAIDAFSLAR
jgi:carboxyl-terminal processing protease